MDECLSCEQEMPRGECFASARSCGHHCNCSWTQDFCHWCGEEFGETSGVPAVIGPNQGEGQEAKILAERKDLTLVGV